MKKNISSIRLLYLLTQVAFWFTAFVGSIVVVLAIQGALANKPILPSELGDRFSYNFSFFESDIQSVQLTEEHNLMSNSSLSEQKLNEIPNYLKWIMWLNPVIMVGLIFAMIYYFRRLVIQVYKGEYFDIKCIQSLKTLSLILVVGWVYDLIIASVIRTSLQAYLQSSETHLSIKIGTPSMYMLIAALFIWSLSIVFQEGLRLKEENELTV